MINIGSELSQCYLILTEAYPIVNSLRRYNAVLVPTTVVIFLQPCLLRLAVDAHVQKCHALWKGEVELKPAAAAGATAARQSRGRARSVADDVPRLGRVDVSFYDAARPRSSVRGCSLNDGSIRLVLVCV